MVEPSVLTRPVEVNGGAVAWAHALLKVSPLKRQKLRMIERFLPKPLSGEWLDVGSDNGVTSVALRELGGRWTSADLLPLTVESIRALVGERVMQIDGRELPLSDASLDGVVIVDFLEHISSDAEFIDALHRVVRSGGTLIINVPNPKEGVLRRIRYALGQTDAAHGHLRAGYTVEQLERLLRGKFEITEFASYGRIFSEMVDTCITFGVDLLKGRKARTAKGSVVTHQDTAQFQKSLALYRCIAPVLHLAVWLDRLVPFLHGNLLIVRARKV